MADVGIDISEANPKRLTQNMIEVADIVVLMGCGEEVCPVVPKEIINWELDDPLESPSKKSER